MTNNKIEPFSLAAIVSPLLFWYDQYARILPWRQKPSPYQVWVSEIMLQQTRVEAVRPYFLRWMGELPTIASFARAPEDQILKLWEGLGYYNRVRNMQKAAQIVVERYDGDLPASYDELLDLPGIGPYTAGAIASIAFQLPVPCVDGNVLRVISRILEDRQCVDKESVKSWYRERLLDIMPKRRPGDFNQALMELGATVCLPKGAPLCDSCPVSSFCSSYAHQSIDEIPVKAEKKPRRKEELTIFLLFDHDRLAIRKREPEGLLASLWEFPHLPGKVTPLEAKAQLKNWGICAKGELKKLNEAKHIFTHVEWQMAGYSLTVDALSQNSHWTWATKTELVEKFAIPSAFSSFLNQALSLFP